MIALLNRRDEASTIVFWNTQRKGANVFNHYVSLKNIKAAKACGVEFLRLSPDKFPTKARDFLIGNADNYQGLVAEDLNQLKQVLHLCAQENMPVVLTLLSLPGSRWRQNNEDNDDLRIWNDPHFQRQAAQFWQDLALELRGHPAIVAYNILNEPHPEKIYHSQDLAFSAEHQQQIQNTLFCLYESIVKSIRKVDQATPIILDSSLYADAKAFEHFKVLNDEKIIYSFHMYEPYAYTNYKTNKGRFRYPGIIFDNHWDKKALEAYMRPVLDFQKTQSVPKTRILVGEFGGHRTSLGLADYFKDLVAIFKKQGWHFAFYAFQEDTWDGMDYELADPQVRKSLGLR